ncbi:MAG TPA: acetoacetate decarboxylase family protein [Steroidobacteraceae bacterium]|nr:acetoacetate decarboxylase family protein [Steroidobacteraceae bacterium]
MAFDPKRGSYYRMPVFFGPTPGPRSWPPGRDFKFDVLPKRTSFGTRFLTRREQLQAWLPDCFEVWGEPVVTVEATYFQQLEWLAGRGYNMCDVKFNATFKGKDGPVHGSLVLVRFENLTDPILSGREELGHNKLYCAIPPIREQDGKLAAEMSWLGYQFLKLSAWDLKAVAPPKPNPENRGMLSYKYVPATGQWGVAEAEYATLSPVPKLGTMLEWQEGHGKVEFVHSAWEDLPTLYHMINAYASLDQLESRGGYLYRTEGGASGDETHRLY